jgi:hypothetical protein
MKLKRTVTIFAAGVLIVIIIAVPSAFAVILKVGSSSGKTNETIQIPITVDNPIGIAGAAFTVVYDNNNLNLIDIQSNFFDTFANQWAALSPQPAPYPPTSVVVDSTTYTQPLIRNLVSDTGMMIAAARCSAETNPNNTTLFILFFTLKAGAPANTYAVAVVPTILNNINAGYDLQGETIAMLVGADASRPVTDPEAYPILLDTSAQPPVGSIVTGSITFIIDSDGDGIPDDQDAFPDDPDYWLDADMDGIPDDWEWQIVDANLNDNITGIDHVQPADDFDGDRCSNLIEYRKGTDPTDANSYPSLGMPWLMLLLDDQE